MSKRISHEHIHDIAIGILNHYNMNNECNTNDIKALTSNYLKRYIEVTEQLEESQSPQK
ncbi:hypothetical protein [Clostridium sp. DMHC 10]|uniref:hypothetical protein n=1 Tax=Clostridium sp. DMHC 10 TaxID=747377 RepID=UPI000A8C30F9|nr:hypothetical protein [Clostridium sp. DMHC 10]